jgi:small subunit ribosomal protein S7
MPRGKNAPKRSTMPDPKFNNVLLAKFINMIMKNGKKTIAQDIVYSALDKISETKKETNSLKLFNEVVDAVKPQVEVRSRRVGGANYQVPMPVSTERQNALAFRWIIAAALARRGKSMAEKLSGEMIDALAGTGGAIKKKEDTHRMAEANKAFAHFARR